MIQARNGNNDLMDCSSVFLSSHAMVRSIQWYQYLQKNQVYFQYQKHFRQFIPQKENRSHLLQFIGRIITLHYQKNYKSKNSKMHFSYCKFTTLYLVSLHVTHKEVTDLRAFMPPQSMLSLQYIPSN